MQLEAAKATCQTVCIVLRMQVLVAAEYDREGTLQAGGGVVAFVIGEVS